MKVTIFVDRECNSNYFNECKVYRYMLKINRTNLLSQKRYKSYNRALQAGERFCKQNGWEIER